MGATKSSVASVTGGGSDAASGDATGDRHGRAASDALSDAEGDGNDAEAEVAVSATLSDAELEAQRLIESEEGVTRPTSLLDAPIAGRAPEDLKRIKGIGPVIERTLNDEGVYYFDQIAEFGASDIAWADRTLAVRGRVVRDRWVPQAQGLAALGPQGMTGDAGADVDTAPMHARFASLSDEVGDDAGVSSVDIPEGLSDAELEAQRLIESDEVVAKPDSALSAPRQGRAPDDLKQINGIGPKIEETLNGEGIYYFDQIAGFGGRDLAWADRTLGFRGRVVRDRWIPQAKGLASLSGASVAGASLAGASVGQAAAGRASPYHGDDSASGAAPANAPLRLAEVEALRLIERDGGYAATSENRPEMLMRDGPVGGKPDDLKRIRGIGEKLEGVLNGLGVYYFRQIATFSARDIAWVDSKLKFKGRIIRDRWVPQADMFEKGRNS